MLVSGPLSHAENNVRSCVLSKSWSNSHAGWLMSSWDVGAGRPSQCSQNDRCGVYAAWLRDLRNAHAMRLRVWRCGWSLGRACGKAVNGARCRRVAGLRGYCTVWYGAPLCGAVLRRAILRMSHSGPLSPPARPGAAHVRWRGKGVEVCTNGRRLLKRAS